VRASASEPRIAVALDTSDLGQLTAWARTLAVEADVFKVGLEALVALGPSSITAAAEHAPVFCDLKLHDIPNTVAGAAASVAAHGAGMLTVHASGGHDMIAAAVAAAPGVEILAVTVLTSLDDAELERMGMAGAATTVPRLARSAEAAGAAGIVCAGGEVAAVRDAVGAATRVVVPGIRPHTTTAQDQVRIVTPERAVRAGADLLVVGRPVTAAADPIAALRDIRRQASAGMTDR
jgi:orotidine-5'-phosphate decarboxylase